MAMSPFAEKLITLTSEKLKLARPAAFAVTLVRKSARGSAAWDMTHLH